MSGKLRTLRPIRKLGVALVGFLTLDIVLSVVMIVLRLSELGLLRRAARGELVSFEEATRSDQRVGAITIVQVVLVVVTGVVWLFWQHRSQSNLHAARMRDLKFSPGWAVGWWLIPFANFVMPFQTTRELWKASTGDERWLEVRTSIIGWWWAAWLSANVLDRIAAATIGRASTIGTAMSGSRLFLFAEVVMVFAGILAIVVVRSVVERQEGLRTREIESPSPPARPDIPQIPT